MYRINRLSRPVLITVDEVVTKAMVEENMDVRFLINSIEVAEERFIAPTLGEAFYNDFITEKNVLVTNINHDALVILINESLAAAGKNPIAGADLVNGMWVNAIEECTTTNYNTLWNRFLWKICAEAVDILAIVPSWTRSTAAGQQQNNPKSLTGGGEGSGTASMKDVQYKVDHMLQARLFPLIAEMKKWICDTGGYTLYDCKCDDKSGLSKRQGGLILGVYEETHFNGPDLWQSGSNERRHHG